MQGQSVCRVKKEGVYHVNLEDVSRIDWVGEARGKESIKRVNKPHANYLLWLLVKIAMHLYLFLFPIGLAYRHTELSLRLCPWGLKACKRQRFMTQLFQGTETGKGKGRNIDLKIYLWAQNSSGWPTWDSLTWDKQGPIKSGQPFISSLCTFSAFIRGTSCLLSSLSYQTKLWYLCYGPKPKQNSTLSERYSGWYICYLSWL